ncbi:MAG TPA: transporter substrate-binding domain-containing protein, partial [Streptomyces sp.]
AQNCTAGGQIHVVSVSTPANALDAVRAGAADAAVTDFPSAELAVRQSESSLEFVGEQIAPGPYGFAVGKHDRALSQALKTALDALIKDGTYGRLLAKYHLTSGAVSAARINGGQ